MSTIPIGAAYLVLRAQRDELDVGLAETPGDEGVLDIVQVGPTLVCPYCGEQPNMEIGPDEEMPVATESAKLISVVQGEEEVERMDALLSLAVTGGDYNWM